MHPVQVADVQRTELLGGIDELLTSSMRHRIQASFALHQPPVDDGRNHRQRFRYVQVYLVSDFAKYTEVVQNLIGSTLNDLFI